MGSSKLVVAAAWCGFLWRVVSPPLIASRNTGHPAVTWCILAYKFPPYDSAKNHLMPANVECTHSDSLKPASSPLPPHRATDRPTATICPHIASSVAYSESLLYYSTLGGAFDHWSLLMTSRLSITKWSRQASSEVMWCEASMWVKFVQKHCWLANCCKQIACITVCIASLNSQNPYWPPKEIQCQECSRRSHASAKTVPDPTRRAYSALTDLQASRFGPSGRAQDGSLFFILKGWHLWTIAPSQTDNDF